jgi:hypothetical protein
MIAPPHEDTACGQAHTRASRLMKLSLLPPIVTLIIAGRRAARAWLWGHVQLLFETYFHVQGVSRAGPQPAPRARLDVFGGTPRNEWSGRYALPVPEAVSDIPEKSAAPMPIAMRTWAYGDVAEILHMGSYRDASISNRITERPARTPRLA